MGNDSMAALPRCTKCGQAYPLSGAPYLCSCGGVFDFVEFPKYSAEKIDRTTKGMWQYREMFGLGNNAPGVDLGEGNTPLLRIDHHGHEIQLKMESQNPTGSYKDRGSAVLTSFLLTRGIRSVVEDSSGNAGASLAAYVARAGIQARIFVPQSASGPKKVQIETYGAELVTIPGPRAEAARAVRAAVKGRDIYASHAFMPFGLLGIATISYEVFRQLGDRAPGTVVAPVGHGGLLYGLMKGFKALLEAQKALAEPYYVGVQTSGCAPVFNAYQNGEYTLREPEESDTIAEGVRVRNPVRGMAILREMAGNRGKIMIAGEEKLALAYDAIAAKGVFVEPTSALVWAVLDKLVGNVPEPIVLVMTGTGYKSKF